MALERKKPKRKLDEEHEKPTKDEYAVARYLRFNCEIREGKLVRMPVQCFIASKAVDTLLESKWSATKNKKASLFTNRHSCVAYLDRLLHKGLFHRAEKVERKKDKPKKKKKESEKEEKEEESAGEMKERKGKKKKKGKKEKELDTGGEKEEEARKKDVEEKKDKKDSADSIPETSVMPSDEKKKKGKKLKLNMHDDQQFVDGDEVFVWIYDPVPVKTFLIGLLMVLGAIGLCLFPLWPEFVRIGVYYISLGGAGFVGLIIVLGIVRLILFCFIWAATLGKHHFWLFPNLLEDAGILESFQPLYKHDVYDKDSATKENTQKKITEKDKEGDGKKDKESDRESGSEHEFEMVERTDVDEPQTERLDDDDTADKEASGEIDKENSDDLGENGVDNENKEDDELGDEEYDEQGDEEYDEQVDEEYEEQGDEEYDEQEEEEGEEEDESNREGKKEK